VFVIIYVVYNIVLHDWILLVFHKIGDLSGGEKARVALSVFCLVPHNVLVLDEPSNHLDVSAIAALQQVTAKTVSPTVAVVRRADIKP